MKQLAIVILLLAAPLALMFRQQLFHHDYVGFSNDAPLGSLHAAQASTREITTGVWCDLNYLGKREPSSDGVSAGFRIACEYPLVFITLAIFPVLFIALRWGACWAVFWVNMAQLVFISGFIIGIMCGWIDPNDTLGWMVMPVGKLLFIPSMIIIMVHEGLNEDPTRQVFPGMFPTWQEFKLQWKFWIPAWSIFGLIVYQGVQPNAMIVQGRFIQQIMQVMVPAVCVMEIVLVWFIYWLITNPKQELKGNKK